MRSVEIREIEKEQGKALKRIFQLSVSTAYTGITIETGIWFAEPKIQYATMMLYRMKNSDDNRKVKQVEEEQDQNQFRNTFYQKVQKIANIYKLIFVMSTQPVNQNGKKGKRESNRQNKKNNERRYTGKNKISHTTEWQMRKETIYQKV